MIANNNKLEDHALNRNLQGVNEIGKPGLIERTVKLSEVGLLGLPECKSGQRENERTVDGYSEAGAG